ncbi:MAG: 6-phosphogluconolactonase [Acidimicrobiales bacterium]
MRIERIRTEVLAARAALWIADRLWEAIADRGSAHVAVSGGATPAAMLAALAELRLPWDNVHVWQVDERVAPDGDPARNAGQLSPLRAAHLHPLPVTATDLAAAAAAYAAELARACGGVLDVVHLGLGDDGHTASWPPGVKVATDTDVAVMPEFRGHVRLTLTPPSVNRARAVMLLVAGGSKLAVLERFLAADPALPATLVRRDNLTVLADDEALAHHRAPSS